MEELGHEEYAMLPVHVERDGDLMSEVNLILTNCGARNRSDWERMMEVTRLTELLKAMQTGSQEERDRFPGVDRTGAGAFRAGTPKAGSRADRNVRDQGGTAQPHQQ